MGGTANVSYILNNDLDFGGGWMATGISSGDDFNGNGHLLMNGTVTKSSWHLYYFCGDQP